MTDIVYRNTVDGGRFNVQVIRTEEYKGLLLVTVADTNESLLSKEVGLSYAARFGPDVADVAEWEAKAIDVIDKWLETNP